MIAQAGGGLGEEIFHVGRVGGEGRLELALIERDLERCSRW